MRLAAAYAILFSAGICLAQPAGSLLPNGALDDAPQGAAQAWTVACPEAARVTWESGAGIGGTGCVSIGIVQPSQDDATVWQDLTLQPHSAYILRGSIRGEGIEGPGADATPVGPSISTSLWKCDSVRARGVEPALGTFDWRPFALDFATGPDGKVRVGFRFGRGKMTGKAFFDNLSVEPNPETEHFEGRHVILNLHRDEVELATREGVQQAIRNTDLAYEAYVELTGRDPVEGKLSAWAPRLWDIEALGWSGNPVLWVAIKEVLGESWRREGFCPEVFLHELAHDFDYGPWVFDGHFSELFFYYACETRNLAIAEDGWRRGADVRNRWIVRGREGVPNVCAVVLKAIEIRDEVGWEPFRKTYRWFLEGTKREPISGRLLASYPDGKPGVVTRELWRGAGGAAVSDLTTDPRFAAAPDATTALDRFETPANADDDYGDRVRGYLLPEQSGEYTFWLACDDSGELWLSPDEDPAHKRMIASVHGWSAPRQVEQASQQSESIHLEAGKRYYIEALHVEGGGADHLSVALSSDGRERLSAESLGNMGTAWGKFLLYFDKLAEFSGHDVWAHFTEEDLQLLQSAYSPAPPDPTTRPADVPPDVTAIALTDTAWDAAGVGWLKPARDATGDGMPLRSDDRLFLKGLYAHAPSCYTFSLGGKWSTLATSYGLQRGHAGSVVFVIRGDGNELFRSEPIKNPGRPAVTVDLRGIDRLELVAEDAGDGPNSDWAVWFGPELTR